MPLVRAGRLSGAVHFGLVHGAYHGAWCWELLRPELEAAGHRVSAVDLPCEDPSAGAERYATAVIESLGPEPGEVVLVGHSLAGLTIPAVAERIAVRRMVFLCALVPIVGLSFDAQNAPIDAGFRPSQEPHANPDGSASWPEAGAIEVFYHDCPPAVAAAAARRLRPQQWRVTQEVTPVRVWPAVPVAYILTTADRAVAAGYSRAVTRDRLGVDPIELEGGHSPFLSRPAELAQTLLDLL